MREMVQVDLSRKIESSTFTSETMTTWVDNDSRLAEGRRIVLKDDKRVWTIEKVYKQSVLLHTDVVGNRGWDNNNYDKHDGTSMKARLK